jgi:hypothetical protein
MNFKKSARINEKLVTVKRQYTSEHPGKRVSLSAPVRNEILSHVDKNEKISIKEFKEFLKKTNETNGSKTSMRWVNKNSHLFNVVKENGEKFIKLSAFGKRVLEKTKLNESATIRSIVNEEYSADVVDAVAKRLGVDIELYDMEQLQLGMAIELEHGSKMGDVSNITGDDVEMTLRIVLAHLQEDPQYYTNPKPENWAQLELDKANAGKVSMDDDEDDEEDEDEDDEEVEIEDEEEDEEDEEEDEEEEEVEEDAATLQNTPGMGDAKAPSANFPGSGDIFGKKQKTQECDKKDKKYKTNRIQTLDEFIESYKTTKKEDIVEEGSKLNVDVMSKILDNSQYVTGRINKSGDSFETELNDEAVTIEFDRQNDEWVITFDDGSTESFANTTDDAVEEFDTIISDHFRKPPMR